MGNASTVTVVAIMQRIALSESRTRRTRTRRRVLPAGITTSSAPSVTTQDTMYLCVAKRSSTKRSRQKQQQPRGRLRRPQLMKRTPLRSKMMMMMSMKKKKKGPVRNS